MFDALVVGGGPAGLSAALVLGRSCRKVLVCDDGRPRNGAAEQLHGFLSRDGVNPRELLHIAREQLRQYTTVSLMESRVTAARRENGIFQIQTADGKSYAGRTLLLATGLYDELPAIPGLRALWGRSVFVCPYSDAWEFAGKRIAVAARGRRAVQLAQELRQWSGDVLICAEEAHGIHDEDRLWVKHAGAVLREGRITAVRESDGSPEIVFEHGAPERAMRYFSRHRSGKNIRSSTCSVCRYGKTARLRLTRAGVRRCIAATPRATR